MSNNVRCEDEEENTSSYIHSYANTAFLQVNYSGPSGGTLAPDPSNKQKKTKREWSSSAPKWRTAAKGLSLEGKNRWWNLIKLELNLLTISYSKAYCYNSSCQAYNGGYILVKWGYRDFDFFDDRNVKCPMCSQYVQTKNFGFYDTWYKVVGSKKDRPNGPSQKVETAWDYAPTDYYTTFLDSPEDLVYWGRLEIKVSKSRPY